MDDLVQRHPTTSYSPWWEVLVQERPVSAGDYIEDGVASHRKPRLPIGGPYARPRNLIQNNTLIEVDQDPKTPTIPYIAVSYTWDPDPSLYQWHGRPVTTQALGIASRLARYTSLALWIDAICIAQDDPRAKQEELPKMADIYRGAVGVVCLVGDVTSRTCALIQRGVQLTRHAAGRALQDAGDTYGAYVFATAGENTALEAMFGHRWWERAWTFQEAVLNRHTYIVGEAEDTIPIDDVLELGLVVRRRAASTAGMKMAALGRPSAFWDSVVAMSVAAQRPLSLGESISCVWRRNAGVRHDLVYAMVGVCGLARAVETSYSTPFERVLLQLFNAAASLGDLSWLPWCSAIDHALCAPGMGLVPTPEHVLATPFTSISPWRGTSTPTIPPSKDPPGGVLLPYRSAGIIRPPPSGASSSTTLQETIDRLRSLGHMDTNIWDMLFGLHVGLIADIDAAVGGAGLGASALRLALLVASGERVADHGLSDMGGALPHTQGITFANYALMAAAVCVRRGVERLTIVSCQAGEAVLPSDWAAGRRVEQARVYMLPVEPGGRGKERHLVFVGVGAPAPRAYAVALLVRRARSGQGGWQTRLIR